MKKAFFLSLCIMSLIFLFVAYQKRPAFRINLTNLQDNIVIPPNVNTLELARGSWIYVFNKEKTLKNTKFTVSYSNYPETAWTGTSDGVSPSQAYVAAFYCIPGRREAKQSPVEQQLKVEILPGREDIKESAREIRNFSYIEVSGIQFRLKKHIKDGAEQVYPSGVDISKSRVFYVTGLKVENKRR